MDKLSEELQTPFQHLHFEKGSENPVGNEYRHHNYRRKAMDGMFLYQNEQVLFEFHGDYWHGHPSRHGRGETRVKKGCVTSMETLFIQTENMMRKVAECTKMRLFYVWEYDYDRLPADKPVWSIVREFVTRLVWN